MNTAPVGPCTELETSSTHVETETELETSSTHVETGAASHRDTDGALWVHSDWEREHVCLRVPDPCVPLQPARFTSAPVDTLEQADAHWLGATAHVRNSKHDRCRGVSTVERCLLGRGHRQGERCSGRGAVGHPARLVVLLSPLKPARLLLDSRLPALVPTELQPAPSFRVRRDEKLS